MIEPSTNNKFVKWWIETFARFFKGDTPEYFKTIQIITAVLGFIASIPDFMLIFDIKLPELWIPVIRRIIQGAVVGSYLVSKLPNVNSVQTRVRKNGVTEITVNNQLPYTKAVEETKAKKSDDVVIVKNSDANVE